MTEINKALTFAKECLKWGDAEASDPEGIYIEDLSLKVLLRIDSLQEIQQRLSLFLGNRFFIQINRGTSSLFKWSVIVGLQNRTTGPPVHEHGRGDGDDMLDAIFDACVAAVRLYPESEIIPQ